MCGILSVIGKKKLRGKKNLYDSALMLQRHRGPDSWDSVFTEFIYQGHVRLSIIDVSKSANQPLTIGDYSIAFNGEIYNFSELRRALISLGHTFRTKSDTEVILVGFIEFGKEFFKKIRGMFAIVIIDMVTNEFWAHRDGTGQKPLFYYEDDEKFIFSSSLKSIRELVPNLELAGGSIDLYIFLSFIPQPFTIFKDVHKLQSGTIISCVGGKKHIERSDINTKDSLSIQRLIEETTVSDVPLGISLSAGLDSTLVASVVKTQISKAFHLVGQQNLHFVHDDSRLVERFCSDYKIELVMVDQDPFTLSRLDDWIDSMDEPFGDSSAMQSLQIARKAKQFGTKVVLTGDGADELFAGYRKHKAFIILSVLGVFLKPFGSLFRNAKISRALKVSANSGYLYLELSNMGVSSDKLTEGYKNEIFEELSSLLNLDIRCFRDVLDYDRTLVLEGDMLVKSDRTFMLYGIEARPVFANSYFGNDTYRVYPSALDCLLFGKKILKKIGKKFLPSYILDKPKSGFDLNLDDFDAEKVLAISEEILSRFTITRSSELVRLHKKIKAASENKYHRNKRDIYVFYVLLKWLDSNGYTKTN